MVRIEVKFSFCFLCRVSVAGGTVLGSAQLHAQPVYSIPYEITTYAGSGSNGSGTADGPADLARFSGIMGVTVDASGNIYLVDAYNSTIRKVSPAGDVTTIAGLARKSGAVDGVGSAARFFAPYGIVADHTGNLFVADYYNYAIRKITPDGTVTTFAGSMEAHGSTDGTGPAARFQGPRAIAVDAVDNLYVSDGGAVRKITPSGTVTTLAGSGELSGALDGTGTAARFGSTGGLAVDSAGNVYVADQGNSTLRRISTSGVVTTVAGQTLSPGADDGQGVSARFNQPIGVALDGPGNIYVSDSESRILRKVTSSGYVSTLAGTPTAEHYSPVESLDGLGSAARFAYPCALAMANSGNLLVADGIVLRNVRLDGYVTTIVGAPFSPGANDGSHTSARFRNPFGIARDSAENLYVTDTGNHTVRKITAGIVTTIGGGVRAPGWADGIGGATRFNTPCGIAVDAAGNVYVADQGNHVVRKISVQGLVTTLAGLPGGAGSANGSGTSARFKSPTGVAVDAAGNVYVADAGNSTLRKISTAGDVTTIAGTAGSVGKADGVGTSARFNGPVGVTLDASGNIYVADEGGNTIRKVTANGSVTTFFGFGNDPEPGYHPSPYFPPGQGANDGGRDYALFNRPAALAFDGAGNLFVADLGNNSIRRISAAGIATTLGGGSGVFADGIGSAATFDEPSGIAVDDSGAIYIADSGNNAIRHGVIAPNGRLINLSARTSTGTGEATLIAGLVTGGAGTSGSAPLLIRGAGPTLANYGVGAALADPALDFFSQGSITPIASNNDWSGDAQVTAVGSAVGAFPFASATSKDAALCLSPATGVYSVRVAGVGGTTGIALAEIYDASPANPPAGTPRLINLSVRSQVGTGENVLIAGFVVQGPSPVTVLVRGIGPSLAAYGITGALADPQLTLTYNVEGTDYLVASNDNWGGAAQVSTFGGAAGAFPLGSAGSKDAALLVNLAPGIYSAKVSGVGNTTGVALVEVYEIR